MLLQTSAFSTLKLNATSLGKLSNNSWQAFCNSLHTSNLTTLSFSKYLFGEDDTRITPLFNAIAYSKITRLNFDDSHMPNFDLSSWQIFLRYLQESKIRSFGLQLTDKDSSECWQYFCDNLDRLPVSTLQLRITDTSQISWRKFLSASSTLKCTSLHLSGSRLDELNETSWKSLCVALESCSLPELSLKATCLYRIPSRNWPSLFNALTRTKITSLELSLNQLHTLPHFWWVQFLTSLQKSNITLLKLHSTDLQFFKKESLPKIVDLLSKNTTLRIELEGPFDKIDAGLQAIIIKMNCRLISKQITKLTDLAEKRGNSSDLSVISDAISLVSESLHLLEKHKIPNSEAVRTQLHSNLNQLFWIKGFRLRDQALAERMDNQQALFSQAIEAWLSIMPHSDYYQRARFELFQLYYLTNRDETQRNDIAFLSALSCLSDEENMLVSLDIDNQRVFDGYLLAAVGDKEDGLQISIKIEKRLALLQYLFFSQLRKIYLTEAPEHCPPNKKFLSEGKPPNSHNKSIK